MCCKVFKVLPNKHEFHTRFITTGTKDEVEIYPWPNIGWLMAYGLTEGQTDWHGEASKPQTRLLGRKWPWARKCQVKSHCKNFSGSMAIPWWYAKIIPKMLSHPLQRQDRHKIIFLPSRNSYTDKISIFSVVWWIINVSWLIWAYQHFVIVGWGIPLQAWLVCLSETNCLCSMPNTRYTYEAYGMHSHILLPQYSQNYYTYDMVKNTLSAQMHMSKFREGIPNSCYVTKALV